MHNHSSENERQALETDDEVHEIMSNGACTANVRPRSRASMARSLSAASTIIHTTRWTPRRVFVFILLSLVYFLTYSCLSLLSTFFTVEAQQKGARDTVIGLIFGMYPLVAFASAMMYGGWVGILSNFSDQIKMISNKFVVVEWLNNAEDRCELTVLRGSEVLRQGGLVSVVFIALQQITHQDFTRQKCCKTSTLRKDVLTAHVERENRKMPF
ncbi:predicted protein [Nematostella vectensis]|uniref:Uncharacterized protein n=1 Tax=Nematostella vectensis TaxID=45351 RepID=A7T0I4_NEMVE|nr:predicted protein [Nematostella vectensis]|eukprot:XP_001622632.1 predicted protein [Nematostella vectensis]